ncbi:MAG: type II toxin-antitoxin system prevent-host-death family antitoxin [Solirubrobacterales bacterium]|nr:type II toxin-antitoxin system prevent-host-death family antitoxin [Solirubrobacterales bacterium]
MAEFGMHEAKTNLSRLVERAMAGEEVVLTRRGKRAVRLVPEAETNNFALLRGVWEGKVEIREDFDELPDDIADAFGIR